MRLVLGVDDTDNLESRGTGHLARQLAFELSKNQKAEIENITRHQLLVHKDIPYTSHNSSASIVCKAIQSKVEIIKFCRQFLIENSAEGSDAGLCVANFDTLPDTIKNWGKDAKLKVLHKDNAHEIADKYDIYLEGLTGKKIGVIGALAATGLRAGGNDGRVLWIPNLRETKGTFTINSLKEIIPVEIIETIDGNILSSNEEIILTDWTRPIIKNNKITLIVQKNNDNENQYTIVSKEYIKSITE